MSRSTADHGVRTLCAQAVVPQQAHLHQHTQTNGGPCGDGVTTLCLQALLSQQAHLHRHIKADIRPGDADARN